jgi:hypothetical protein
MISPDRKKTYNINMYVYYLRSLLCKGMKHFLIIGNINEDLKKITNNDAQKFKK